jgi:hypothetical protein
MHRACFRGWSDYSAGICGEKSSRGVEVGGASCQFACPCAVVAGTTSANAPVLVEMWKLLVVVFETIAAHRGVECKVANHCTVVV